LDKDSELSVAKVESFIESFFWMLPNIGIALAVIGASVLVAWGVRASITRVFRRRRRENLGELLAGSAKWGIIVLGLLIGATIVFPSISPANLLSTLGIGSIAIGFAFKDILQNWIAGLLILVRQPFRRGDQIKSGEFEGTVEHIEARATLIKTYDGQRVVIPNSDIYTQRVRSRHRLRGRYRDRPAGDPRGARRHRGPGTRPRARCAAVGARKLLREPEGALVDAV
jgi:small-conductance mechanosensitive channel